ncbi:hypothetical protein HDF24_01580 [Mucilaginibacter sp. X4EP1]|uniref:hypothetical protein n=1 Tax=Mucilaginibacter sp. X4EP1 TaxID=2723092 RepID=UPI00216A9DE2|nr:hypothetical protein [Mucilaginibacter sp. X4EP1]MCS3811704.1 hypothetical protein [Mucilaginibacter sp. X4EP1]
MKKLLAISPYFPPLNAADMQRIRTSLPYFKACDWDVTVVIVDERYTDQVTDNLLLQSIPQDIKIHKVKAFSKRWTSKLGLGSIALRSLWFYHQTVNRILKGEKFDLIYFSTTQFPVCVLGSYWKSRFKVPYVIDMQDPWHSDYYKDKPKEQRPRKYWFSYRLNKYLEPLAMKKVNGLISVSEKYIVDLKARYPQINDVPEATITFGAFEPDVKIATDNHAIFDAMLTPGFINVVYVGRGGADMHRAISLLFEALKKGLNANPELFGRLKFWFVGTSYAPAGEGIATIAPLAIQFGIENSVIEITDRVSYYQSLALLQDADALFIPGSDDPQYTASKIYPYLLTQKPLLAIFNEQSSAVSILKTCATGANVFTFNNRAEATDSTIDELYKILAACANNELQPVKLRPHFEDYSAKNLTAKQAELFDKAIKHFEINRYKR